MTPNGVTGHVPSPGPLLSPVGSRPRRWLGRDRDGGAGVALTETLAPTSIAATGALVHSNSRAGAPREHRIASILSVRGMFKARLERFALDSAGFTLVEAIAAVAAMGAIVTALGMITGLWLPNWRHGFMELQRADLLTLGIERVVADVSSAEYVTADGAGITPLFVGEPSSLTFVRRSFEPNSPSHLEVVRIRETVDDRGYAIVRETTPFAPSAPSGAPLRLAFGDAVTLVRAPFRVSFAYAGPDRAWMESWRDREKLPDAIRVTVREATNGRVLAASTAVALKVTAVIPAALSSDPDPQVDTPDAAPSAKGR